VPGAWLHLDARRIKDLFHRHLQVKLCLSGHIHLVDRVDYLGVTYCCSGAVSGGWWDGPCQEFPNGYGLVTLYNDGSFDNRYVAYRRLLAALEIDGDEPLQARGQALRAFMPVLREGCEALLARAPGLLD
jgi:hypothetical protein